MKRIIKILALFAVLHTSVKAYAADISSLVRDLNTLQNRMAIGDLSARDAAARQFDVIEQTLDKSGPETWADEKSIRAVIVYLLCGGVTQKFRKTYEEHPANGKLGALLAASLLYAEGGESGVPKELMEIDPKNVPQVLGGHLALIQAGALIGKENARAVALLDMARLLMPGSLVEEAALRREIGILDPVHDVDKLALLSFRYVSLYGKSPYAKNFWDTFQRATTDDPTFLARAAKFASVFEKAPPALKVSTNLDLARQAMITGKFAAAHEAIERAAGVGDAESSKRISAYRSVLTALRDDHSGQALAGVDRSSLNAKEAALVAMASSIVSALSFREAKDAATRDETYEIPTVLRRAIADSDELLKRAKNR